MRRTVNSDHYSPAASQNGNNNNIKYFYFNKYFKLDFANIQIRIKGKLLSFFF